MDKRSRRRFTKEFKSETVALIRHSGKSIAEICRDMGLAESSVHRWLAQAEIDGGQRDGLTSPALRQGTLMGDQVQAAAAECSGCEWICSKSWRVTWARWRTAVSSGAGLCI